MNKFIISESEKQRILEMHQNATSRQYLSENTTKEGVYTTITLYYDLSPNKVKKRVQYMSFSTNVSNYYTEDIQTIRSFEIGGTVLSPTAQKMSPEKVITGTLPYNKSLESLIGKGAITSTANTLIPTIKTQDGKVVTSMTPLFIILTVVEQQRQTPIQKESDLTRIVKRVINERQYLMEDEVRKVIPIEIAIPAVKNQKTGKLEPKRDTAYLSYFAKNSPGKRDGMSSLMNETNFLSLRFGDIECSRPSGCLKTSKKDDQGNIVGSIYADQKLLNVLKTWVGQTDSSGSLGMKISTQGPEANTVIGSPKVYYKEIQPTQN